MMKEELQKNVTFFKDKSLDYAFDSLTGVLNRDIISEYAKHLVSNNISFSFCLLDIDNFKYINDNYGHMLGDMVLKKFSEKLVESTKGKCVVGRFGGDEFILVAEGIVEYEQIWAICHKLNKDLSKLRIEDFDDMTITATTGVSRFPTDGKNYDDIFETADKALYRGKAKGRNCFIIYLAEKHAKIKLSRDSEATYSSMDQLANVFQTLTKNEDLKTNIEELFKYLSATRLFEHIGIETDDRLVYSYIQPGIKRNFEHIEKNAMYHALNNYGLFYINRRSILKQIHYDEYFQSLVRQKIESHITCSITAFGKTYGVLRVDSVSKQRIWQNNEMDIILTVAKLIGTLLYCQNKTLDDIYK